MVDIPFLDEGTLAPNSGYRAQVAALLTKIVIFILYSCGYAGPSALPLRSIDEPGMENLDTFGFVLCCNRGVYFVEAGG